MMTIHYIFTVLTLMFMTSACASDDYVIPIGSDSVPTVPRAITVEKIDGEWELLVAGEPYYVNGAAAINFYSDVKRFGGNTIRLYSARSAKFNVPEIMDQAYNDGLMVYLGLGMSQARSMDYTDEAKVAEQKELLLGFVRKYMNHPALLCWSVGNELEISNVKNVAMWEAIGDLAKSVKEIDRLHPVTCTLASAEEERVGNLLKYAPDIDFVSVNSYYPGVSNVLGYLQKNGDIPYMITEYGPQLYSSPPQDRVLPWSDYFSDTSKAKIEETSTEKEAIYKTVWENSIKPNESKGCLGSFAFVWGYQTSGNVLNWYSLFTTDGYSYGACDALQKCWTGEYPAARAPKIEKRSDMTMDGLTADKAIKVKAGTTHSAKVKATSSTDVKLRYSWRIFRENDSKSTDGSMPDGIAGLFTEVDSPEVTFKAPIAKGAYRLYAFAYDDVNKKAASACIPFYVEE